MTRHYLDVLDKVQAAGLDAQISVKPTQLGLDLDKELCFRNLQRLIDRAEARGNFVWIDMESSPYVDPTLDLFRRTRARSPRDRHRAAGVSVSHGGGRRVAGAARRGDPAGEGRVSRAAVGRVSEEGRRRRELLHAGVPAARRRCAERRRRCCTSPRTIRGWPIGSPRSSTQQRVPKSAYEFAMLYGIQRPLQQRLVAAGRPLRVLIAYGEYWFPWYMRRLAERPANVWFVVKNIFR